MKAKSGKSISSVDFLSLYSGRMRQESILDKIEESGLRRISRPAEEEAE